MATGRLPARERALIAAQVTAGLAAAVAWTLADPSGGHGWIGLALAAAGAALALLARRALGGSFRIAPSPREGARLVRRGVYRWLRHPMYVSVCLVLAGAAVSRPDRAVLALVAANFVLYLIKARYEESVLLAHYPDYAAYREGTLGVPVAGPSRPDED